MPTRERKDVYQLPAGDTTLEWYAKAVAKMRTRPATDPTSWSYQAAIHGFNKVNPYWGNVGTLPPPGQQTEYWKQCQHGSWYFLPWHRMYLAYFEQIVAKTIVDLGGPPGWSLPFWNYSDTNNPKATHLPPAFIAGTPATNPLQMPPAGHIPGRKNNAVHPKDVTLGALKTLIFQGAPSGIPAGFGGPVTGFSPSGSTHGDLESKPHDLVHVDIGGAMGNPQTAGLDPIFYLHHANIDRLWQVWLNMGHARHNPKDTAWLNFAFDFHDATGTPKVLKVSEVLDTTKVLGNGYSYQGVPASAPVTSEAMFASKLFSAAPGDLDDGMPPEVAAATNTSLSLDKSNSTTSLQLLSSNRKTGSLHRFNTALPGLAGAGSSTNTAHSYLNFENIIGKGIPPVYDIYLNLPDENKADEAHFAGALPFFGVETASSKDSHHNGSGQHYVFDISDVVNSLRENNHWDPQKLQVHLRPREAPEPGCSVEIGRISLYVK
ncbi:tyrosinase family protein [Undibacterium sp. TS12]|uniref:tyrosinase family protein n=1 Tax=Undibacterium sp. TS12 TaxID=2908202 RepID=UPI001F4CCF02|nr:tyrosinase family protein [Undibacterium sp. TS12]MCH8619011.1 tyrosinase family protein [Undibacterium sp. TS12]